MALLLKIESIETLLIENLNHIKKFGISRLGIFGSYSKGCPSEDSDIDILITFEPNMKTFDNYIYISRKTSYITDSNFA